MCRLYHFEEAERRAKPCSSAPNGAGQPIHKLKKHIGPYWPLTAKHLKSQRSKLFIPSTNLLKSIEQLAMITPFANLGHLTEAS